jgi:hypothetical protein
MNYEYNVPVFSKITIKKLFPPTLISLLTSDIYRVVGGTEIMVSKMVFDTLSDLLKMKRNLLYIRESVRTAL